MKKGGSLRPVYNLFRKAVKDLDKEVDALTGNTEVENNLVFYKAYDVLKKLHTVIVMGVDLKHIPEDMLERIGSEQIEETTRPKVCQYEFTDNLANNWVVHYSRIIPCALVSLGILFKKLRTEAILTSQSARRAHAPKESYVKEIAEMPEIGPISWAKLVELPDIRHKRDSWNKYQTFGPYRDSQIGSSFIGKFHHGKRTGFGIMIWDTGDFYIGEWEDNMRHGHGICNLPNGRIYQGGFNLDKRHREGS